MAERRAGWHTRWLVADLAGVAQAAAILQAGGLVAFPTETVYGLGAHALDPRAVQAIFEAKRRPSDDPLIIHLTRAGQMVELARPGALAWQLAERFWPGPLTLVMPRLAQVPSEVTAGLDTVALRVPAHALARALLEAAGLPIAAPSANLFGRPSPTRAQHVLEDLAGRIDAVLDGGPTSVGLESTIVDVSGPRPRLLRPGGLPAEEIEAVIGLRLDPPPLARSGPQAAPGLLAMHYSPRTPLTLVTGEPALARLRLAREVEAAVSAGRRVGVLLLEEDESLLAAALEPADRPVVVQLIGTWEDPGRSAARLFDALRALDVAQLDVLVARDLADPAIGLGRALADRLRRAARQLIDSRD